MMLNDEVKYMNYANKLSDGVIERILRPDIIIVKDTNTQYEEKINKSNILINVSIVEKNILYKLIKNQNNNHEILINDINMIVNHLKQVPTTCILHDNAQISRIIIIECFLEFYDIIII